MDDEQAIVRALPKWLPKLARAVDGPADTVVANLVNDRFKTDEGEQRPRRDLLPAVLQAIGRNGELEPSVKTFLDAGVELDDVITEYHPAIEHAQEFFDDNGVAIIAALFHASLPEAYLGKRGVQVLDITGELFRNWTRRVQETGQFLMNVLSPTPDLWQRGRTSLSAGEFGARAARRVRLIHAAIRWMLNDEEPRHSGSLVAASRPPGSTVWNGRMIDIGLEHKPCAPLNQEDLLATLGTFTTVVFEALDRLGVPSTDTDRDAFYLLWNVVGWHLGIGDASSLAAAGIAAPEKWKDNALLPITTKKMDVLYRGADGYPGLARRLQEGSDQGRRMTKALLQELAYPLPQAMQGFPAFLTRYFVGDKADGLGVEKGGYVELLLSGTSILDHLARDARSRPVRRLTIHLVTELVTRYALRAFVAQARWSERGLMIDKRIAAKWGVQVPPDSASMGGPRT